MFPTGGFHITRHQFSVCNINLNCRIPQIKSHEISVQILLYLAVRLYRELASLYLLALSYNAVLMWLTSDCGPGITDYELIFSL